MRFDDRLATALAWAPREGAGRGRLWRQLVDLLAQAPDWEADALALAIGRLKACEADVPIDRRRATVAGLRTDRLPGALIAYLEREPCLAEALGGRSLDDTSAQPSLPMALATAINPAAREAAPAPVAQAAPRSQIADLLDRIEAHRTRRARDEAPALAAGAFAFRIDAVGRLTDADGAALPATCSEPALGVDGQAAGAWRLGAAIVDARLVLEDGVHAGEWRMSAEPEHDADGRVTGYRGTARPPRADQSAVPAGAGARATPPELDDAIERLRDPLEAIGEVADPARLPAGEVRAAAVVVAEKSAALLAAVDALELAVAAAGDGGLDVAGLLVRIDAALQPLAEARGLRISFRLARGLPAVEADPQAVERMVARLIGAVVALARRGERVVARLGRDKGDGRMLALSVTRPGRLFGRPAHSLLEPPPTAAADAPELGLSFALRLVDRLAREAGGSLAIHADRLILSLPLRGEPRVIRVRGEVLA